MSTSKESQSELKERTAALNTLLRFGRERPALVHAYKLRAYLQLRGARIEPEQRELERVEKVISELERRKTSGIQKLIKTIIDTAKASWNPEVDDETTLLDHFKTNLAGDPDDDLDLDDGDEPEGSRHPETLPEPALATTQTPAGSESLTSSDGWGGSEPWGDRQPEPDGWTAAQPKTASESGPTDKARPKRHDEPTTDYWGGGEGYNYDDHL
jgi:hypothetical protein